MKFPLTQKQFLAWRKKNPKKGQAEHWDRCPIAMAVREITKDGSIRIKSFAFLQYGRPSPLPLWAQTFIRKFDAGEKV